MSYDQSAPPPPPGDYGQGGGFQKGGPGDGYGNAPAQKNTKGLVGVILSALGLLCGVLSIVGIVLGVLSLNESKTPGRESYRTLALAAIGVGVLTLIINVIFGIVRLR